MLQWERGMGFPHRNCITLPLHYHQSACISVFVCLPINLSVTVGLIDPQADGRDRGFVSAQQEYAMSDMNSPESHVSLKKHEGCVKLG